VANRKDSQGICFVGNVEAREFLARRLQKKEGVVLDAKGERLGKHEGVWFYTIGQRGGWVIEPKVQQKYVAKGETPIFYVMDKRAEDNVLVVGEKQEIGRESFTVKEVNLIGKEELLGSVQVRIRHGGEMVEARLKKTVEALDVELAKPLAGIASGQSAVFYRKGECLGGGVIA